MTETLPQKRRRIAQTIDELGPDRSVQIAGPTPDGYTLRHLVHFRDINLYGAMLFNCWQGTHADDDMIAKSEERGQAVADDPYLQCEYLALIDPGGLPCGVAMAYRQPGWDSIDDDFYVNEGEVALVAPEGERMFPLSPEQTDALVELFREAWPEGQLTYMPSCFGWHLTEFEHQVPWSDQMRELIVLNYDKAHAYERERQMRRTRKVHPRGKQPAA